MRKQNGVTLVALVITIVVLIILAGISINMVLGDNGIITIAKKAKENVELAKTEEEASLNELYKQLETSEEGSNETSYDTIAKLKDTIETLEKELEEANLKGGRGKLIFSRGSNNCSFNKEYISSATSTTGAWGSMEIHFSKPFKGIFTASYNGLAISSYTDGIKITNIDMGGQGTYTNRPAGIIEVTAPATLTYTDGANGEKLAWWGFYIYECDFDEENWTSAN